MRTRQGCLVQTDSFSPFFSPRLIELLAAGEDPLRTQRLEVSVLFLDLRGFTVFVETSEPEEVIAVLHEYHSSMGKLIVEYGATVERFTGDGLMAFFTPTDTIPETAAQAVHMAVAMRDKAWHLTEAWRRVGYDLGFVIGVAHGYATVGAIGFEGRWDYAAIGQVTNLASRLCDHAGPGQLLISRRLMAKVEHLVRLEAIGAVPLKGFVRPVEIFNVIALKESSVETQKARPDGLGDAILTDGVGNPVYPPLGQRSPVSSAIDHPATNGVNGHA